METVNHETYVSLEMAKLLKQLGFDWQCKKVYFCYHEDGDKWELEDNHYIYTDSILKLDYCLLAPTLEVAQRWLREVKGYELWVYPFSTHYHFSFYGYLANEDNNTNFDTYEQALEAGIKVVLELILEKGE